MTPVGKCPYAVPLGNGANGPVVRCEWLTRQVGSGVSRSVGRCEACQDAGSPSPDNLELQTSLVAAYSGRIIMFEHSRDAMFGGLTAEDAADRLRDMGTSKADMVHVLLRAHDRGMDAERAVAMAERMGVADAEWEAPT